MATMDSSTSVSSRESLYSVDSTTSEEEEDEPCANFEVFLSDSSSSDAEKAVGPLRSRPGAYPDEQSFRNTPRSKRTNLSLPGQGRRPLGRLTSARLRPASHYCRYPAAPEESYCARLRDADSGLPRKAANQRRVESGGRKRPSSAVGGGQPLGRAVHSSLAGVKRYRSKELAAGADPCTLGWTEGDQLFAQKCRELQGFILPLQELLGRLRMGRFDRGLSSFQQSVAMDRIQRIIGVLQKPGMGERYLGTLLQVERMLKVWFPHVALKSSHTNCGTAPEDVSEMAEKPPSAEPVSPGKAACRPSPAQSPPTEELHQTHLTDSPDDGRAEAWWGEQAPLLADWPAMNLTWIHTSPISNPPLGPGNSAFGQALLGPAPPSTYGIVLFLHGGLATPGASDRSISGTPALPPPACIHSSRLLPSCGELPRCQSLPGATQGGSGGGLPGRSLACHSTSLPCLPTSGEKLTVPSERPECGSSS
ncbi:PREDICTED: circadian-associated transcriptional repressor [Gekko japonicus]|uniref:Circadian-associated transcriptional repressor n=1 Tax=Gekko japonicus TaxID=146911 RepID=A0ABM1JVV1_GEKJA|nr:PREDICTED: circadian-associated transcriptional repressor [Gekko japonicus]XP_015265587.1 PREDICTED: circadian-associated transcriptional repressor [Gekko japonicus]XP_015265588.1 PREDICTED: circadian-associated transcriptional repressor [Gekko japonicus]XP_015265589.1 PREDICTED: circadian-associated transcriptional repressor [Gekko japonicus]XP_015265590.1 PREDICTED: circadian-associated transcriptional repressor [Gekko japonicus]